METVIAFENFTETCRSEREKGRENTNENKCIVHICLGSSIGEVEQVAYLRLSRNLNNYINEVIQNSRLIEVEVFSVLEKYF